LYFIIIACGWMMMMLLLWDEGEEACFENENGADSSNGDLVGWRMDGWNGL